MVIIHAASGKAISCLLGLQRLVVVVYHGISATVVTDHQDVVLGRRRPLTIADEVGQ